MQDPLLLSIIFVTIAVIFNRGALRDYLKAEGKMTIPEKFGFGCPSFLPHWGLAFFYSELYVLGGWDADFHGLPQQTTN